MNTTRDPKDPGYLGEPSGVFAAGLAFPGPGYYVQRVHEGTFQGEMVPHPTPQAAFIEALFQHRRHGGTWEVFIESGFNVTDYCRDVYFERVNPETYYPGISSRVDTP